MANCLDYAKIACAAYHTGKGQYYEDPPGHMVDDWTVQKWETGIVFGDGFPRPNGRGKLVPASIIPPDELPDENYPMILTTGRQLEHWHTGAMTRRASVLDELEPEAVASLSPADLAQLDVQPGEKIRVATRRGAVELRARADEASHSVRSMPRDRIRITVAQAATISTSAMTPRSTR